MLKKSIKLFIVTFAIALFASLPAVACTGAYVGKKVSANGTTIIARTRDSNILDSVSRRVVNKPLKADDDNPNYTEINGFTMEIPETTYRYISGPLSTATGRGTFGASCINSEGLAITATVTAIAHKEAIEADPFVKTGISEACIGDVVAMSCTSAEGAVKFLGDLVKKSGNAEPNVIMIADQNEAWMMEFYTGHEWAAIKMPEDKVSVFGNAFNIDPVHESYDAIIMSENLVSTAEKNGFAKYDKENGKFDLFASYCGDENIVPYSNMRNWYGLYTLGKNPEKEYHADKKYPTFFEPKGKIGVSDIAELYRSRYEGTEYCPDTSGRIDCRIIGTETQYSVDITEIYDDLPKQMCAVSWVCLDNAEFSPFIPFNNVIDDVSVIWSQDMTDFNDYTRNDIAFYAFQNLNVLSITGRDTYGKGVRKYWKAVEDYLMETYPDMLKLTAELYEKDDMSATKFMTDYLKYIQNTSYADALKINKELEHYLALNQRTFDVKTSDDGKLVEYKHPEFESELQEKINERYSVKSSGTTVEMSGLYSWIKRISNYAIKYIFNKKGMD